MFCLCVKKSNKKRQLIPQEKISLSSLPTLPKSLSTSTFAVVHTKFTRTRDPAICQHARLLRVRRLHATRRSETRHARRSGAAQPADGLSSPLPPHIPPVETLHHSNPPHRQGSNFRRISGQNDFFCSFWGT